MHRYSVGFEEARDPASRGFSRVMPHWMFLGHHEINVQPGLRNRPCQFHAKRTTADYHRPSMALSMCLSLPGCLGHDVLQKFRVLKSAKVIQTGKLRAGDIERR